MSDPVKDLADHAGFVREDLIAGLPTPLVLGHIAVPIGGAAEHVHRPDPGRMALATPVTLDDLGPLILGNHPLHLQQQVVFRALPQGSVEEHDLDASASELIHQQDLVGIFPGQAIWRVDRESVHAARGEHIAQALQRRADERGSTIPFIQKLHRLGHGEAIGRDALLQRRHLTRDGVRLGLLLRRHAGGDRHLGWIHDGCLLPTCCVCRAPSSCRGGRVWGVVRRVMGTTRSYACATQAGLTRLGSKVMRTSRVVLRVRARRATTASLLPWRGLVRGQHRGQRCPEKPIPIPGAQLCAWNARRALYQKVGNFVGSVAMPPCGVPLYVLWYCQSSTYPALSISRMRSRN